MLQKNERSYAQNDSVLPKELLLKGVFGVLLLFILISAYITHLSTPPSSLQEGSTLIIEKGMSVQTITRTAEAQGVVRSNVFLYIVLNYLYDPTGIYAGTYSFDGTETVYDVAEKLASNNIELDLIKITIPEGTTVTGIGNILEKNLPEYDSDEFTSLTSDLEGYLFPDTYFVTESFTTAEVVTLMRDTFFEKTETLQEPITASPYSEYEILTLASIVEREANDAESMKLVAGVFHNRLAIGMALQADASIEYELGKPLNELTADDLDIDSPYNTYLYPGLPPTPIGNPGLIAIEAILEPTVSDYFYYITDNDGEFHYSKTLDEHNRNVQLYLRTF